MKKWKIIKIITIAIILLFIIYIILNAIVYINMKYPHPMLGIDANNWLDQFGVELVFIMITWGIPLIIDIVILIISILKIKKLGSENNE